MAFRYVTTIYLAFRYVTTIYMALQMGHFIWDKLTEY
jgi:hypothetical protein